MRTTHDFMRARLLAGVLALALMTAPLAYARTSAEEPAGAPADVLAAATGDAPALAPAPVVPARLDPALATLVRAREASGTAAAQAVGRMSGLAVAEDRVAVAVEPVAGRTSEASAAVVAAGGRVFAAYEGLVDAEVPVATLAALADSGAIARVSRPQTPVLSEVVGEGAHVMNASAFTTAGIDGSGVKVGIIDGGFHGYAALLGSELPTSGKVTLWGGVPGKPGTVIGSDPNEAYHGAAVAEVVHDMAPGAHLYLARISDAGDLAAAKDWMVANKVQVINHSASWLGGRLDGTGWINKIVTEAVRTPDVPGGIVWANAAGNMRYRHWSGDFTSRADDRFTMRWGNGQYVNLTYWAVGDPPLLGQLWWNNDDWNGHAIQDYNLILLRFDGKDFVEVDVGAQGRGLQDGSQYPYEEVYHTPWRSGWYGWAIYKSKYATRSDVDFDFFTPYQDLQFTVAARSITTPADNPNAGFMASGAVAGTWTVSAAQDRPGLGMQESYSSEGPTLDRRVVPDLMAPDDVSTRTFLYAAPAAQRGTFSGTSASSAYLAGAAALVRAAFPASSAADVESYLKRNAVDSGAGGVDMAYGTGIAQLPYLTTPTVDVGRLSGADRYATSLAISRGSFESSVTTVVVATGAGYADALAGAPLAGVYGSPVLLVHPGGVSTAFRTELARLGARHAIILGSTAAVSSAVDATLQGVGLTTERLQGPTRFDTAAAIARRIAAEEGPAFTARAWIVNGNDFPDALAASPFAYYTKTPILPVGTYRIAPAIQSVVHDLGFTSAVIGGGTLAVSSGVEEWIEDANGPASIETTRKGGATRIDTARAIGAYGVSQGWGAYGYIGIATAYNYPDALSGAAAAGHNGGVLMLTDGRTLYPIEQRTIAHNRDVLSKLRVFGGGWSMMGSVVVQSRMLANP